MATALTKEFWSNFPQAGTGALLEPIDVRGVRFIVLLEAKAEFSINMNFVLYFFNPALAEALRVFDVEIPLKTLGDGAFRKEGKFDADAFTANVMETIRDVFASKIDTTTASGIIDNSTNEWVDYVWKMPVDKRRATIATALIQVVGEKRAKAGADAPNTGMVEVILEEIRRR